MEKCLESVLKSSENEAEAVQQLTIFCKANERTFSFHHIDLSCRRKFIELILEEISRSDHQHRTEFESAGLSSLRILSRDKHGLGMLASEKACITLIKLSGLFIDSGDEVETAGLEEIESKLPEDKQNGEARLAKTPDIDSKNNEQNPTEKSETKLQMGADAIPDVTVTNTGESHSACDILPLSSVKVRESVIVEAQKCLCNMVFQSPHARAHCSKYNLTEVVLKRLKWFEKQDLPADVRFFDMRLLFLLTALEAQERSVAVSAGGLCVLTHALDSCVPGRDERERAHSHGPDWGMEAESSGEPDSELTVLERAASELSPTKFKLTEEQLRITEEILKTLFNVTINLCAEEKDTREHCERLILIVRTILVRTDEVSISKLFNHAVNLLVNLPKECLGHLVWSMPRPVWKQLKNYDEQRRAGQFRVQYEQYNTQALKVMLTEIYERVKVVNERPQREILLPLMSAMCYVARGSSICRKYLRNEVLPPLTEIGHERPEEGMKIRGRLVRLMTSSVDDIKEAAADFLFVLCKENVDRLVKYTGYGNAAGLLASRGLMAGGCSHEEDYSSDDDNSDTEEYSRVKDQIDPITGAIPRDDGTPNPLDGMTEEEKEAEAEKLAAMLRKLNSQGIITAMTVDPEGNLAQMKIPDEFHPHDGGSCSG